MAEDPIDQPLLVVRAFVSEPYHLFRAIIPAHNPPSHYAFRYFLPFYEVASKLAALAIFSFQNETTQHPARWLAMET